MKKLYLKGGEIIEQLPVFERVGRWVRHWFSRGYHELSASGGENSDWSMSNPTEDQDTFQNVSALRQRSRDAFKEQQYLRKFRTELFANVFGSKGITLQSKVKEEADRVVYAPDEKAYLDARQRSFDTWHMRGKAVGVEFRRREVLQLDEEPELDERGLSTGRKRAKATVKAGQPDVFANNLIERGWKEWQKVAMHNQRCNYRFSRHLRLYSAVRDGDCFIRLLTGPKINRFGFAIQLINSEWIDHTLNRARTDGANEIRMGIEFDRSGKKVAFHVIKAEPSQWMGYAPLGMWSHGYYRDHERVPASEMIHYIVPDEDSESTRGVPMIAAVLRKLRHLDKYEEYEVIKARAEACKGGHYVADTAGLDPADLATKIEEGANKLKLIDQVSPGAWKTLPFGWKPQAHNPTSPNSNYGSFRKEFLRGICSGLPGGAYSRIGNDYESVNFSSSRAEQLNVNEAWTLLQEFDIDVAERPIFELWLEMSLATGAIPLPLAKFDKFNSPMFQGRRWSWVDPAKEAQANATRLANYETSRGRICNEGGNDFEEIVEEQAIERIILLEAGLNPDPQIGKAPREPMPEKPNAEDKPDEDEDEEVDTDKSRLLLNGNGARH